MWNARVAWWEKEYKYPKDLKVKPEAEVQQLAFGGPTTQPGGGEGPRGPVFGHAAPAPRTGTPAPADVRPAVTATPAPRRPPRRAAPVASTTPPASPALRPAATPAPARPGQAPAEDAPRRRDALPTCRTSAAQIPDFTNAPNFDLQAQGAARDRGSEGRGGGGLFAGGQKLAKDGEDDSGPAVQIKAWDPKTPYIAAMKAVAPDKAYGVLPRAAQGLRPQPRVLPRLRRLPRATSTSGAGRARADGHRRAGTAGRPAAARRRPSARTRSASANWRSTCSRKSSSSAPKSRRATAIWPWRWPTGRTSTRASRSRNANSARQTPSPARPATTAGRWTC